MSATILVYINGTNLSDHSIFVHGNPDAWLSTPSSGRAVARMPGRVRGYRGLVDDVGARTFAIPFRIATYSLANRLTETDWIKAYHRQDITLKVSDGDWTRELLCTVTDVRLAPYVRWDTPICDGVLTVVAPDPVWRATSDTTLSAIGSSPVTVVLGTAPVEDWALAITVSGGSDPRTITTVLKTGAAVTLATMAWTGTIAADTLNVNASTATTKVNTTDSTANHTGGYPVINPKDTPNLTITSSSGTATGVLTHRKRYY